MAPSASLLTIGSSEDTLHFINRVRQFVAKNADTGLMRSEYCDTFVRIPIENFEPSRYFSIFEKDSGTASCGLAGQLMVKLLLQNGIDAYTYNFGFSGTRLAHIIVLVKHGDKLLIFDPYMNYELLDVDGNNLDLINLLDDISLDSVQVTFSSDTVVAEMLIDHNLLTNAYRELINSEGCHELSMNQVLIRDSIFKQEFLRCFGCERDSPCISFVKDFESKLSAKTGFSKFHEGFALKINEIYGAADCQKIDAQIDSIIAHSKGIQNKIGL